MYHTIMTTMVPKYTWFRLHPLNFCNIVAILKEPNSLNHLCKQLIHVSKKRYRCKWTLETIPLYTKTQNKVKQQWLLLLFFICVYLSIVQKNLYIIFIVILISLIFTYWQVTAVDKDLNSDITYRITDKSFEIFHINAKSGDITLYTSLTEHFLKLYNFEVVASDGDNKTSR